MKTILYSISLLLFFAEAKAVNDASQTGIFIFNHVEFSAKRFNFSGLKDLPLSWTPQQIDVTDARKIVDHYLSSELKRDDLPKRKINEISEILKKRGNYDIQCFGFQIDGVNHLHLNYALRGNHDAQYTRQMQSGYFRVFDGGSDYWRVTVNMKTRKIVAFSVNSSG